jgi:predicted nucleic acid-binding protein
MSERRLVDTSVLSLILKRDTRAERYVPHLENRVGVISFITLAELNRWPEERNWGRHRRAELARLLDAYEVSHSDDRLCQTWALLVARLKPTGRVLPFADSWIAATAQCLDLPLVTHNPDDFRGIDGMQVITEV